RHARTQDRGRKNPRARSFRTCHTHSSGSDYCFSAWLLHLETGCCTNESDTSQGRSLAQPTLNSSALGSRTLSRKGEGRWHQTFRPSSILASRYSPDQYLLKPI